MLCRQCDKFATCTTLCPEAERYVNQDYVPLKEVLLPQSTLESLPAGISVWEGKPNKPILTKREAQVFTALLQGKTREEIAEMLGITRENLKQIIRRIRRKGDKFRIKVEGVI